MSKFAKKPKAETNVEPLQREVKTVKLWTNNPDWQDQTTGVNTAEGDAQWSKVNGKDEKKVVKDDKTTVKKFAKKDVEKAWPDDVATEKSTKVSVKPFSKVSAGAKPTQKKGKTVEKVEVVKKATTKAVEKAVKDKVVAVRKGISIAAAEKVTAVRDGSKTWLLFTAMAIKGGVFMEQLIKTLSQTGKVMNEKDVRARINFEARRVGYGVKTTVDADPLRSRYEIVYPKGVKSVLVAS